MLSAVMVRAKLQSIGVGALGIGLLSWAAVLLSHFVRNDGIAVAAPPTFFLFVAPPSAASVSLRVAVPGDAARSAADMLFGIGLLMYALVLANVGRQRRAKIGLSIWACASSPSHRTPLAPYSTPPQDTFPTIACATAAIAFARAHDNSEARSLALALSLVAVIIFSAVAATTAVAVAKSGCHFGPPAAPTPGVVVVEV